MRADLRLILLLGVAALMAGCSQPAEKPAAAAPPPAQATPPPAQTAPSAEAGRIGTVGLVRELKERGMSSSNWTGVIGSIFSNDTEQDVIRIRYEVTIFYKDGTQGVVVVDQRPTAQTGERVRVTGNRIEPLTR